MNAVDTTVEPHVAAAAARLSDPALHGVVAELARRFSASPRPVRSINATLDEPARHAVAGLLGLPRLPDPRVQLRCDRVAAAVHVTADELRAVVAEVIGGLGDRSGDAAAARAALDAAAEQLAALAEPLGEAAVTWAAAKVRVMPGTVPARVAVISAALQALLAQQLVRFERRPLAVVAAAVSGNPHNLDADTAAGALLAQAAAATFGEVAPFGSAAARASLARVGIVADELSSTVTTWALHPQAGHPFHGAAGELTAAGEPVTWTLSTVANHPVTVWPDRVLVVENPAVVAVAATAGFDGTVICSAGRPSVAATTLVAQAVAAGCRVDVHADFDPGGFGITAGLAAVGCHPWKMIAAEYLAHLHLGTVRSTGPVPATPWDPALAVAHAEHRIVVFEEQLLDTVLC